MKTRTLYEFGVGDVEDPDMAGKLHVGEFFESFERWQYIKGLVRNPPLEYVLDHDGGMEMGYVCSVSTRLPDRICTLYDIAYPEPHRSWQD